MIAARGFEQHDVAGARVGAQPCDRLRAVAEHDDAFVGETGAARSTRELAGEFAAAPTRSCIAGASEPNSAMLPSTAILRGAASRANERSVASVPLIEALYA